MRQYDDDPGDCTDYTLDDALSRLMDQDEDDRRFDMLQSEDSLRWKDEVVEKLQDAIADYLSFMSVKDLLQLIADNI